jgi:hypothetical protein
MRLVAACAVVLVGLSMGEPAGAYCRATTSQVPAGYDPVANGCWLEGKPLAWQGPKVPYGVASAASTQVTYAEAARIADLAFDAWNKAECTGASPSIETYDDGPIVTLPEAGDCTSSASCDAATHDLIVFDDTTWPHDDPANTLALTTVTYGVDDGRIFEAYTEVNTAQHEVTTQEPPPSGGAYDLQAILTHEAGHFLGLAHATETTSIMYAFYQPGAVTLRSDDVQGLCTMYPPPNPSGGGSCAASPPGSSGAPGSSADVALAVAAMLAFGAIAARARRKPRPTGGLSSRPSASTRRSSM